MSDPSSPVMSPLTLVMTMKDAASAKAVTELINGVASLPLDQNPIYQALDGLGIVHFARFVFLDEGTKFAVITTYDGSFDNYLNEFIDNIGDIFNLLLEHMADAPPLPVQEHRQEFAEYVKRNDVPVIGPFFSAYPSLTVLDIQATQG